MTVLDLVRQLLEADMDSTIQIERVTCDADGVPNRHWDERFEIEASYNQMDGEVVRLF